MCGLPCDGKCRFKREARKEGQTVRGGVACRGRFCELGEWVRVALSPTTAHLRALGVCGGGVACGRAEKADFTGRTPELCINIPTT